MKKEEGKSVVFFAFRECLDVFHYFIKNDLKVFVLKPGNSAKVEKTLQQFNESEEGCLLMTFSMGATGLNLQTAKNVVLMNLWWNFEKVNQAIARIWRPGSLHEKVKIFFPTSNMGIENVLLEFSRQKLETIGELESGPVNNFPEDFREEDEFVSKKFFKLLKIEENESFLQELQERTNHKTPLKKAE